MADAHNLTFVHFQLIYPNVWLFNPKPRCVWFIIDWCFFSLQSLVIPEKFQHILRIMGTNIDGKRKVTIAMTAIKGCGRRYANIVLKKADVDLTKRAGECTDEEVSHKTSKIEEKTPKP